MINVYPIFNRKRHQYIYLIGEWVSYTPTVWKYFVQIRILKYAPFINTKLIHPSHPTVQFHQPLPSSTTTTDIHHLLQPLQPLSCTHPLPPHITAASHHPTEYLCLLLRTTMTTTHSLFPPLILMQVLIYCGQGYFWQKLSFSETSVTRYRNK